MRRTRFILIFLIVCSLAAMGQIVKSSGYYNQQDTTSTFSGKHAWNLSRVVGMMKWIEGSRRGCSDTIYLFQLDVIYHELKVYCETHVNYALLDKQLRRLNNDIDKAWQDMHQRNSLYEFIKKGILARKQDETDRLILNGIRLYENNKRDSAYQFFKKAVEKEPNRLDNYYLIIMDEIEYTCDTTKALDYLNKLIKWSGDKYIGDFQPNMYRSWIYSTRKQYNLAINDLNVLLAKDSNNQVVLYNHAFVNEKLKNFETSISDYQHLLRSIRIKCIPTIVDSADVLNSMGWTYYLSKQYKLCVESAEKSLLAKPDDAHTLDTRGSGYFGLGEYEKCIDDMTKAIRLDPEMNNSWYLRGLSYLKLNRKDQACADISNAVYLGSVEAIELMKSLCQGPINTGVENQRQFPKRLQVNKQSHLGIDYNGLIYYRFK